MDKLTPGRAAETDEEIVVVIDDDAAVRHALGSLLRSAGFPVRSFASVDDFMTPSPPAGIGCLVLDVNLPRVSGLEFQTQLGGLGMNLPIIFMTGHGDIPMTVRAMRAGALDFLPKPFDDRAMLDAVAAGLARGRQWRQEAQALAAQRQRFETLSPREREIMGHVVSGLMNKQIAYTVGLSEITVKVHRGNVMRKMNVRSLAELVRVSQGLGLEAAATAPRPPDTTV